VEILSIVWWTEAVTCPLYVYISLKWHGKAPFHAYVARRLFLTSAWCGNLHFMEKEIHIKKKEKLILTIFFASETWGFRFRKDRVFYLFEGRRMCLEGVWTSWTAATWFTPVKREGCVFARWRLCVPDRQKPHVHINERRRSWVSFRFLLLQCFPPLLTLWFNKVFRCLEVQITPRGLEM